MAELIQSTLSKKVQLSLSFAPDTPAIEADVTQLRQVVLNLITNASEALGDESGAIAISTGEVDVGRSDLTEYAFGDERQPGPYAHLEVTDTGCGMDAETKSRIFDPFFTTKFTGRGLGLAAVQGIARGHGGAIRIESEPGMGSSFRLLIPTTTKRESTSAQGPLVEPPRVGGSALVVEDDEGVRTMAAHMLAELGFDVIQVGDGFQALTVLKEGHDELALVLLDLMMPRLSGEVVLTELEHVALTAPIILTSGFNRHEMSRRFAGRGVSGFLQKPYDFTELQATVGDVLKAAALLRAATPPAG
jgi:two-component system, cell cycle sensor histidine kinase and response regulator CckA